MKPSQNCIELIKEFEGLYLKAYPDPGTKDDPIKKGKPFTIGYGSTLYPNGKEVMPGDTCTKEEAEKYLMHELEEKARGVSKLVTVPLNQDQFDSLCTFTYNTGLHAFETSTLLGFINLSKFADAASQFLRWTKANGKVLPGLERRRKAESALFLSLDYKRFLT